MANLDVVYTNITCSLPSSDGGGTPGWVWAIVGVACAAALAVVALGAFMWRRRRRRAEQQPVLPLTGKPEDQTDTTDSDGKQHDVPIAAADAEGGDVFDASPFALAADGRLGSGPTSGNTSANSRLSKLTSMDVPETIWRSRLGFIEGLTVGGLIGRGGFAEVYRGQRVLLPGGSRCKHVVSPLCRCAAGADWHAWPACRRASPHPGARTACFALSAGSWHGTPVAVKVVRTHVGPGQELDLSREPMLR